MKNVVITGANRGIGLALSSHYAKHKDQVYALCRQSSTELKDLPVKIIENVSIESSVDKIQKVAELIGETALLINNAAQWANEELGQINYDTIMHNFNVNALGPLRVTESFLQHMKSGSKVVFMTSRMGSIGDNDSGGRYAYRMSKSALNAAAKSIAVDVKDRGISVAIIHPGWVKTPMGGKNALISTDQAAQDISKIINNMNPENTGTFWHSNGEVLSW